MLSLCLVNQRGICETTLCFCLRVIVNKKNLNPEKTTYSVLSVLLLLYGLGTWNKLEFSWCWPYPRVLICCSKQFTNYIAQITSDSWGIGTRYLIYFDVVAWKVFTRNNYLLVSKMDLPLLLWLMDYLKS